MSYRRKLRGAARELGKDAFEQVVALFDEGARAAKEPWQRTLLDILAEAAGRQPDALDHAEGALRSWLAGRLTLEKVTRNPLLASNLLAQLQNAEADRKELAAKWLGEIWERLQRIRRSPRG